MIYCPECGTANRDGSKFCNECGHTLLAHTGVKCPHCDTLNTVQSVFCSRCGGRLLAQPSPAPSAIAPPIKGLSLPTKPTAGEGEEVEQPPIEGLGVSRARAPRPEGAGEPLEREGEEIPDWLRDLQASLPVEPEDEAPEPVFTLRPLPPTPEIEAKQAAETPSTISEPLQAEAEELPSGLADLRTTAEAEVPAGPPVEAELEGELPSWLAELKPPAEVEAPAGHPVEEELAKEELPSWLTELKPPAEAESLAGTPVEGELAEGELPSWLAELKPPVEVEAPAGPPGEAELAELRPSAEVEAPAGPPVEAGLTEGELPSWLAELRPPAEVEAPTGPPAPQASEGLSEAQMMPAWLSDLTAAQAPLEVTPSEGELPDWLVPTPELGIPGEEETLARAEIPDWLLALKPRELKAEGEVIEPAIEQAVEQTGVLAGIRDVLPIEMLIAQPRGATPGEVTAGPFTGEAALVQASRVRIFDEIVTRSPVAAPKPLTKPGARLIDLLPWWIVYALLILAVAVPLLLGKPLFDRSIEPSPSVETLYEAVESLPSNAQVLVAVDYDPTTSGEMDVVAQSIVGHLMDRQAQIVAVSLLPAGPATAENLVAGVAAGYPGYVAGDGRWYVNLGYLPGQAAAVRLMGQSLPAALPRDFEGRQATELVALNGITSTQSFDLIVELAATSDTLQWWIEQAGAPYGIPMVAGVSAAVDPIARTYYETEPQQLKGVIGGVPGAASYESSRSGGAGLEPEMAARLDSLLAGQVLVILVILAGTMVGRNRSRPKGVGQLGMGRER